MDFDVRELEKRTETSGLRLRAIAAYLLRYGHQLAKTERLMPARQSVLSRPRSPDRKRARTLAIHQRKKPRRSRAKLPVDAARARRVDGARHNKRVSLSLSLSRWEFVSEVRRYLSLERHLSESRCRDSIRVLMCVKKSRPRESARIHDLIRR